MNLPNKITLLRVILIPAFLAVYLLNPLPDIINMWLALVLFVTAAITDAVDGYVARRLGLVTNIGKLMDPLADKLLVCGALVALVYTGAVPVWAVIIIMSREFFVSGLRQLALEQNVVLAAGAWGKIKVATQLTLIIYTIVPPPFTILVFPQIIFILAVIATIVSIYSAVDYTWKNMDLFNKE